ncbi:MAG: hypothetical protein ACPG4Z_07295 [Chitinophagales bacterium]
MRVLGYSLFVLSVLCLFSCEKEENNNSTTDFDLQCDEFIIENASRYQNDSSLYFGIDTIVLNGSCLDITIGASGCNGSTWNVDFIDEGVIMESLPIQRNARVLLVENNEACLAVPSRTFSFDLQPIQESSENSLILNIDGWDESILYEY